MRFLPGGEFSHRQSLSLQAHATSSAVGTADDILRGRLANPHNSSDLAYLCLIRSLEVSEPLKENALPARHNGLGALHCSRFT